MLHFADGQRGDHDLSANGVITDPGGPAVVTALRGTYALSMLLNRPQPVRVGAPVPFTILITNSGEAPQTTIPLTGTFNSSQFIVAHHAAQAMGITCVYVNTGASADGERRTIPEVVTMDGAVEWREIAVVSVTVKINLPLITRWTK